MINVNLKSIREHFPQLKRFIARLREEEIELIKDKYNLNVNTDLVMECASNIWTIVAFGEAGNKFDIEIPIESLAEMTEWLGCQNIKDTELLMTEMNMIDDLNCIEVAIYRLYDVLADILEVIE